MTTTDPTPDQPDEKMLGAQLLLRINGSDIDNRIGVINVRGRVADEPPAEVISGAKELYNVSRLDLATELIRIGHRMLIQEQADDPEGER